MRWFTSMEKSIYLHDTECPFWDKGANEQHKLALYNKHETFSMHAFYPSNSVKTYPLLALAFSWPF